MSKRKRVILHIGAPKTGSTALQVFLANNEEYLEQNGICYYPCLDGFVPWEGKSNGGFLLFDTLMKQEESPSLKTACAINYSDHSIADCSTQTNLTQRLETEFAHFKETCKDFDTVILSEECFFHCELFYPDFWPTIKQTLEECFEDVTIDIVVYLRRWDQWVLSKFKEGVTNQYPWMLNFDETLEEYKRLGYFAYDSLLERLDTVFSKEHVYACNYDRSRLTDQCIEKDFFHTLTLPWDDSLVLAKNPNPSITMDVANANLLFGKTSKFRRGIGRVSQMCSHRWPEEKGTYPLSMEDRQALLDQYKDCNQRLTNRSSSDEPFFDMTIQDYPVYVENKKIIRATLRQLRFGSVIKLSSRLKRILKKIYHRFKGE